MFDLNSNPNNFIETLFIRVFLVDCLIFLNNSLIVLKISEYLEGLIPNKVFVLFLFVLLFWRQYFCHCFHLHKFLLWAYNHKNVSQHYNLRHYIVFKCLRHHLMPQPVIRLSVCLWLYRVGTFFPSNEVIICVSTDFFFVKMKSYCLNLNHVLYLCARFGRLFKMPASRQPVKDH